MQALPPSKTWNILGKELVYLIQYWLDAVRKHLITHHPHWWSFLKHLLDFIKVSPGLCYFGKRKKERRRVSYIRAMIFCIRGDYEVSTVTVFLALKTFKMESEFVCVISESMCWSDFGQIVFKNSFTAKSDTILYYLT